MKKIKIFLASSITDLFDDRLAIGDFFRQLNEIYIDLGVHFSLIKCEDYDNSIALSGKQSQYDAEIRDSELCFFLFFRKVGEYTLHEFDVALEAFRNTGRPKIVTYVKYVDSIEKAPDEVVSFMKRLDGEMRHYYNTYGHIDTLKLGVLMQIKLLGLDVASENDVAVKDGEVIFMGERLISTENIPIFSGNEGLARLTCRKRELSLELADARGKYLAEPTDINEERFLSVSSEYNSVSKELSAAEGEMLSLVSAVAELTADGRVLTHRQKEALKLFNSGDFMGAQNILDGEEREEELKRAEARHESAKNELRGYVEENLLWIKAQRARGIDKEADLKIRDKFERAVEIAERYDLEREVGVRYMEYLHTQNEFGGAIKVAEGLLDYYTRKSDKNMLSSLYNTLGLSYDTIGNSEKAEAYYSKAISVCVEDGKLKNYDMQSAVANTLNNRGKMSLAQKRYSEAEKNFKSCERLYSILDKKYPKYYDASNALLFGNLGALYIELSRYQEAEEYLIRAVELHKKAKTHGCGFIIELESEIVIAYVNLSHLYFSKGDYEKSESSYGIAEKILTELSLKDPEAYRAKLSILYANKAGLMVKLLRFSEAEECANKALSSIKLLAEKNEVFKANLAIVYNNVGIMYMNLSRFDEALEYLEKSVEVYTEVYKNNRKILISLVAKIKTNIAAILFRKGDYPSALTKMKENLPLLDELCETDNDTFMQDRALAYTNLCSCLCQLGIYTDAIEYGKRAVEFYEECSQGDALPYLENLALAYNSLASAYCDVEKHTEALEYFYKALDAEEKRAETVGDTNAGMLGRICYNISIVCESLEDYDTEERFIRRAVEEYSKYYELAPEAAYEEYLSVFWGACIFYTECGEFDEARQWLEFFVEFLDGINRQHGGAYAEWLDEAKDMLKTVGEY